MDISPEDFVSLTLPVYKAMFDHILPEDWAMFASMEFTLKKAARSGFRPLNYNSVSFGRILSLAKRQLRLSVTHFEAVLDAIMDNSGLGSASTLQQEQVLCKIWA